MKEVMNKISVPKGNLTREAIDSLRGYVYQIYQSALAWIELEPDEFLFLEVAEDYSVVANDSLRGVQVKETSHSVTINSEDIIASIDSFVDLRQKNPKLKVELRHLTTSIIGKEKSAAHRIGNKPILETWRALAKVGDVKPLKKILDASKLSKKTKGYIRNLNDTEFREDFLKRIHFDCGAPDSKYIVRLLRSKLLELLMKRGGVHSQLDGCLSNLLFVLLQKAVKKEDRFVDRDLLEELLTRSTQIPVNRAQFEEQSNLINKVLQASAPQTKNMVTTRLVKPRPIDEVPFPPAIANRTSEIDNIISSLTRYGLSWIFGSAGVGKTIGAKIAARRLGGNWAGINLRSLNADQVNAVLSVAIDRLTKQKIDGFLIDDLECVFEPYIVDMLLYLKTICYQKDLLLLFTSPRQLNPDFLFSANLPASIEQKLKEFTEKDILEILTGLNVKNSPDWVRYIHVVSGGGHPQLAIAAIQSMQKKGWDTKEFRTLDSLITGNPEMEQVRTQTRTRLLNELPEGGRKLIERLSLKSGSFQRDFVLDMAQIPPSVPDGGIVFDQLIGSWVDQQEIDRFALSPLLSNFAIKTLTDEQKREINFEIANSLIKGQLINPIEANSALLAAWSGKNTKVIVHLCMSVIVASQDHLQMIAPHLMMFTFMRTDTFAYDDDPNVSQMFRGAQLLLLCQNEEKRERMQKVLDRFEKESDRVENDAARISLSLLVYARLLIATPKFGALPNFWSLIHKVNVLLEDKNKLLPPELLLGESLGEIDGISAIGFMFLNQARQIKQISELLPTFEFLESCGQDFRLKLLKPYNDPDFSVDMLVASAWLKEHEANTIDPPSHSAVFARLEEYAVSWDHADLAVCCRKYRVIIIDEYGGDKEEALRLLDEGLEHYGKTNSELVRAKAKVLYRAEDHQGSLVLSKTLIDADVPLSKTEKAFLGRDAAISAEKQGDFETARRYYLYGSKAASKCDIPDMVPMQVGLKADAALTSWHAGDRETCLRDFISVLQELKEIDPESSLRAAHCQAISRHVLLWLNQDAAGEKKILGEGEETKIYPGIVSNPEPVSEIGNQFITPIEMAWYMLAKLENICCLDVGITRNLFDFLPKGPVFEGQFLISPSKIRKALILCDPSLFVTSLNEMIAGLAYAKMHDDYKKSFDIENVTYGSIPAPTLEQQTEFHDFTEQLVLCFVTNCIFKENTAAIDLLMKVLEKGQGSKVREDFLNSLRGRSPAVDYYTSFAVLLSTHMRAIYNNGTVTPLQVFELVLKVLQVADQTKNIDTITKPAFEWLNMKWSFMQKNQRFLLKNPAFYEKIINQKFISKDCLRVGQFNRSNACNTSHNGI